jgi:hypothetical protein
VPVPLDAAYCKPFVGMDCTISVFQFDYMAEPKTNISMEGLENSLVPPPNVFSDSEDIRPGTLSSIAELTIPPAYQAPGYLTAYGKVFLIDNNTKNSDGTIVTSVEIPFTKIDITAPVLSIVLSPNILRKNEKHVPITATIMVKDDYDPQPEVKLESITANEVLEKEDIKGALIGTDDRQFMLRAERDGKIKTGRIYTVTYSATDGSGNKSTASATVTVPHDEREHEGRDRDEKSRKNGKD